MRDSCVPSSNHSKKVKSKTDPGIRRGPGGKVKPGDVTYAKLLICFVESTIRVIPPPIVNTRSTSGHASLAETVLRGKKPSGTGEQKKIATSELSEYEHKYKEARSLYLSIPVGRGRGVVKKRNVVPYTTKADAMSTILLPSSFLNIRMGQNVLSKFVLIHIQTH